MSVLTVSPSSLDVGALFDPTSGQQAQISQALIAHLLQFILEIVAQAPSGGVNQGSGGAGNHWGWGSPLPDSSTDTPAAAPAGTRFSSLPDTTSSNDRSATPSATARDASLTYNAGGVLQAAPSSGISPASSVVKYTGTGTDKVFNVTNATNRTQSLTYSVQGVNKATITLAPGQTGTFVAGFGDIGTRISPSDAQGNTHPNEKIQEDGDGDPDISAVDGPVDFSGRRINMTQTLSNGRSSGDGDAIRAYQFPTDDAAAMGLAGDPSKTINIVISDPT
ncbi:MAG: hypothetical protein ACTHKH_17390 [Trinickia sp.]|jgi:hypothetical protein